MRRVLYFVSGIVFPISMSLAQDTSSTATGLSNRFNPAMSVNTLLLAASGDAESFSESAEGHAHEHGGEAGGGFRVQETEVQLSAFVDPYLRADVAFAQHGIEGIELEEGYLRLLRLPAGLGLRVGKHLVPFGKHNTLHTHQFPFVEAPKILEVVFGEEGLNEVGVEGSVLLPTPWYSEVLLDVTSGDNEVLFQGNRPRDFGYVARWRNLFDLHPTTTLDVGLSGVAGVRREETRTLSNVVGVDLTLKRRPLSATHGKTVLQGEFLRAKVANAVGTGGYALAQYQFARRWWVQGGFDWASHFGEEETDKRIRVALAFVPTEFSALKLQYNANFSPEERTKHQVLLQLNATIGAHPAHAY